MPPTIASTAFHPATLAPARGIDARARVRRDVPQHLATLWSAATDGVPAAARARLGVRARRLLRTME